MKYKVIKTEFTKVTEIQPEIVRNYMVNKLEGKFMDTLYNNLKELVSSYPNFEDWFDNTVRPEIDRKDGKREIIVAFSEVEGKKDLELTGIAILKKTSMEKKICAIRIHEDYRNQGIGSGLFEYCFKYLDTRKPIMSICEDKLPIFEKHINKYRFELKQTLDDYYVKGKKEYVFNGTLYK